MICGLEGIEQEADIIIYGTGEAAKLFFIEIKKKRNDIRVKAFVDSYKKLGDLFSKPVINVSEVATFSECKIVIASMYHEEIADILREKGCNNFCVYKESCRFVELYDAFNLTDKSKLQILSKMPQLNDKSTYFVIATNIDHEGNAVIHDLDMNNFFEDSFSYTDQYDYMYEKAFKKYDKSKFSKICIVDAGCKGYCLAELVKYITVICRQNVQLFKIPFRVKLTSIVESKKLIFIDICKNGTSSTIAILDKIYSKQVKTEIRYKNLRNNVDVTSSAFNEYNKFTIVRNPYTRLASLYLHLMRVGSDEFLNSAFSKIIKPYTFSNFCKFIAICPDEFSNIHFESQTSILTTPEGVMKDVSFLRFENYAVEIAAFLAKAGEEIEVVHENRSRPSKCDYISDYYTPELIKLVNERYKDDFINFGYEFL
ncbi:Sulfotransferase family protein [Maridesulfovibrio ferrireducens]|uniref:Sulfotransferase family protein n=1 Tax=Maridesulfovibrio ferrireducens TaxID=246191 RepID=A0A1G9JPI7_9BACT|nr:sulfotransferase family 2 domain-containing protein [Maridesulfovibrio ferrireducens]SDL39054.1 Sulfotransferase family protein [Maridesulfovibrio ferrireducens]